MPGSSDQKQRDRLLLRRAVVYSVVHLSRLGEEARTGVLGVTRRIPRGTPAPVADRECPVATPRWLQRGLEGRGSGNPQPGAHWRCVVGWEVAQVTLVAAIALRRRENSPGNIRAAPCRRIDLGPGRTAACALHELGLERIDRGQICGARVGVKRSHDPRQRGIGDYRPVVTPAVPGQPAQARQLVGKRSIPPRPGYNGFVERHTRVAERT